MDSNVLNDMMAFVEVEDYPIDSVLVIKNGTLVFERYPSIYDVDSTHELHSVTKSFTSTLIGIALHEGYIDSVDELVLDFFPEYTQQNPDNGWEEMTIEHLLTMTAGFEWDENRLPYLDPDVNDIGGMIHSDDAVQFVLDKPMDYTPGEYWEYSGGASLLLGAIVQHVYNQHTLRFAEDFLFEPLGIDDYSWATLAGGWLNTFGGSFRMIPRDMAKLGYLYLNNGTWNGTQILSESYVHNATRAILTNIGYNPDYTAYGWQWWTLRDLESFAALGRAGQKIIVNREHELVVVFTAHVADDGYDPEFELYFDYILESIGTNDTSTASVFLGGLDIVGLVVLVIVTFVGIAAVIAYTRTRR